MSDLDKTLEVLNEDKKVTLYLDLRNAQEKLVHSVTLALFFGLCLYSSHGSWFWTFTSGLLLLFVVFSFAIHRISKQKKSFDTISELKEYVANLKD